MTKHYLLAALDSMNSRLAACGMKENSHDEALDVLRAAIEDGQVDVDEPEDDVDDDTCWCCHGSGGGFPPWACPVCSGTGRIETDAARERRADLAERMAEERRDG
jgi:hypothetical protein